MAERRMFAKSIVLSDAFLDMPMSARCLYFTLGMLADDDGFIGNPKSIMRQCGASNDDMLVLIQKRYVLDFENGIIVIKHWRMNNLLRSDRYKETTYIEEKSKLKLDEKGAYTEHGIPNGNQVDTQYGETQYRLGKDSIGKNRESKKFTPPTLEEIQSYIKEKNLNVDGAKFYNYFTEGNWIDSKGNKVKNWKQKLLTWDNHNQNKNNLKQEAIPVYEEMV